MPEQHPRRLTRRRFVQGAAAVPAIFHIVPRFVLGGAGQDQPPPSETFGGALIGVGGRGPGTFEGMKNGLSVRKVAECDVKFLNKADNKYFYTDFRRVLERKDVELVAIATPPHWHALISIAAAEAGKDVLCEKPLTRFIAEGRAVVNAFKRYNRVLQIGTFGRFSAAKEKENGATGTTKAAASPTWASTSWTRCSGRTARTTPARWRSRRTRRRSTRR
jgi:myo-inositol 2-dehydrogenase / D-chiro-inositol 1-dehydrogenase